MKSKFKNMDIVLFILLILFTIFGLVMVFSSSWMTAKLQYGYNTSYFFIRQLLFILFAYFIGFIILFIDKRKLIFLKKFNNIYILIAIGLLVLTLLFGISVNGAKSWLKIGIQFQPSEFAKTLTILYIALAFRKESLLKNNKYILVFVLPIIVCALIVMQPDIGTAATLLIPCFLMFLAIPTKGKKLSKFKIICGGLAICMVCMLLMGNSILENLSLKEYQLNRLNYKNPCTRYSETTGYQVCNGYIAINNGGLFGLGLGNSTQKYLYLPEAYTDFIFPIIVEEFGSIVAGIIIILFIILLYRLLKISKEADDLSNSLIAYGTFGLITTHLLINLLGVLALIPLTGVPLPFLSYGGSFVFNIIILIFICLRISIENKNNKIKRAINSI